MTRMFFFMLFAIACHAPGLQGQATFNKLYYLDFPSTVFNGVVSNDSCFYIKGTIVDTMSPLRTGLLFARIDLDGTWVGATTVKHPDRLYDGAYCNLIGTLDGNFMKVAAMGDSVGRVILLKYAPSLDTILTKKYYGPLYPALDYVVPRTILERPDGGYAILFGHESVAGQDFDISLLLLDSDYNIEQYKVLGSTSLQETATALILDDDGGYIVGANRENGNVAVQNLTSRTLLIKTDPSGSPVWQWLSPANEVWGEAEQLIKTPDGGLVVASKKGYNMFVNPFIDLLYWEANVFKLDADRNMVWNTPLRGYEAGPPTGPVEMVESLDGSGYVVTGLAADSTSGPEPGFGCFLAKVSPQGDSLWMRHYAWIDDVKLNPEPWSMAATPDGGYVIVGMSLSVGQHVPGWVLKVDSFGCLIPGCQLTATEEPSEPEVRLAIYPNPTSDFLNFQIQSQLPLNKASFQIVNVEGKVVQEITAARSQTTYVVPVWDWAPGVYYLQLLDEDTTVTTNKFIVSH